MATIKEDYVSFETANLLKEKGFNSEIDTYYSPEGEFCIWSPNERKSYLTNDGSETWWWKCIAPSQSMAMKWLREVHGLHISLESGYDYDSMHVVFLAFVQNVADVHEFMDGRKNVASYPNAEKSYELAIKYCLENLI